MNPSHRHFHRLAWVAVLLALGVIVFGGFVRLSNAGRQPPKNSAAATPKLPRNIAATTSSVARERVCEEGFMGVCAG